MPEAKRGRRLGSKNINSNKPFKEALLMEARLAEHGEDCPAPKGSLRWVARNLLERAGEETNAAREVADRLDGKATQHIAGDADAPPVQFDVGRLSDEDARTAMEIAKQIYGEDDAESVH